MVFKTPALFRMNLEKLMSRFRSIAPKSRIEQLMRCDPIHGGTDAGSTHASGSSHSLTCGKYNGGGGRWVDCLSIIC